MLTLMTTNIKLCRISATLWLNLILVLFCLFMHQY